MQKNYLKPLSFLISFAMVFAMVAGISTKIQNEAVYAALRANSQYSLAGAQYQLYNEDGTAAKDANGNNAVLTTDANGNTSALEMEQGTYFAQEIKASPGYKLDPRRYTVEITDSNTSSNPATFTSTEPPVYGIPKFAVYKYDKDGLNGWKDLLGAEFTVKYYDVATKDEIDESKLMKTWKFKTKQISGTDPKDVYAGFDWLTDPATGDDFYVVDGQRVLPLGWFTIQETDAPAGMAINDTLYYGQVRQPSSGADAETILEGANAEGAIAVPVNVPEAGQSVELKINKQAAQEGKTLSSKASLAGAEYEVYYDDPVLGKPELVGKITTDENGQGSLTERTAGREAYIGDSLEPGDYYIKEVKPSPGFLLDKYVLGSDGVTTEEFSGAIEVIVGYDSNGEPVTDTITGSYEDGQHVFKARALTTNAPVFEFTTKSLEYATETHIKKTDATTTKELPGATLQIYSLEDNTLVEEWVSTEEEHIVYGLPSGDYLLREITAPYGYDVAEDIEFTVANDQVVTKVEMANKPLEIGTIALDADTNSHQGTFKENAVINDKVSLKGLYVGRTYQVKGTLYNKETGETVKDSSGNEVTAECEPFEATAEEMEVEVKFNLDTSAFKTSDQIVVFERLYRTTKVTPGDGKPERPDEEVPVDLAKHEDPEDPSQTINYGGIVGTVATGKGGTKNILGDKDAVIIDTVKYENLSTEETYTVKGELYDKTEGKLTGIKAEAQFKPESSNGTTTVEFKFDASQFKNHKLVVYETLLINDIVINSHEDPDDPDQTVNVPEIETLAVNPENNEHIANAGPVKIKDTVSYKNLVPNKEYRIEGTLQYRDGLFGKLKTVMKDGAPLTAEAKFTPTTESGTVEVTFTFDAADLEGKTTVVFENLYEGEYLVAAHVDPDDEDQSIHHPKIRTKVGKKDGDYVIDVVKYENLIPGIEYRVEGYFVEKNTGDEVEGSDGEITFTPDSPNGKIEVKLKPVKKGTSLVAFESVYTVTDDPDNPGVEKETLVGEHKDIDDPAQTLTPKGTPKTGETSTLYLAGAAFICMIALGAILARKRKAENR